MARESQDSNLFWRLDSGEHLNLLDEAIERIGELEVRMVELAKALDLLLSTVTAVQVTKDEI